MEKHPGVTVKKEEVDRMKSDLIEISQGIKIEDSED